MPKGHAVRFPVDPRDVPPGKAARRLHLTRAEFDALLPALIDRGFPRPDPTTGNFDLVAIDRWMDSRSDLTSATEKRNGRELLRNRIAEMK